MRILLTGSTGYIGRRLLPVLVEAGHEVVCLVRDARRFDYDDFDEAFLQHVQVIEADLEQPDSLAALPKDIDAAYYLVHGMRVGYGNFSDLERQQAQHFVDYLDTTTCKQVIYLSGLGGQEEDRSLHLQSRHQVEDVLASAKAAYTTLRAAIIIGSGSASFEIIRDLVEKLPVMVGPKWVSTRCQPIGIRNVIQYLVGVLHVPETYNQTFDIGGPQILTYKQMLEGFAEVRKLSRRIVVVPTLSPQLSSMWLYFVTSTNFSLARNLVDSLSNEVVCNENRIRDIVPLELYDYPTTLQQAFTRIRQNEVVSSWTDAMTGPADERYMDYIKPPKYGCLQDKRVYELKQDPDTVLANIFAIGGDRGWYYGDWLWAIRGAMDRLVGGVGLRRGRRSPTELKPGDALDFWRVLAADRTHRRLLLYAEMKLPGEAWLEYHIKKNTEGKWLLYQTATFRPKGLFGRLYWYTVLPFHELVFPGMAKGILNYREDLSSGLATG